MLGWDEQRGFLCSIVSQPEPPAAPGEPAWTQIQPDSEREARQVDTSTLESCVWGPFKGAFHCQNLLCDIKLKMK